jgi:hypothetical protein
MGPQTYQEEAGEGGQAGEWIFLRFYDYAPDGTLGFNVVTLRQEKPGEWHQHVASTQLRPWQRDELVEAFEAAGFRQVACWGDMQGVSFDPVTSGNLIMTARSV